MNLKYSYNELKDLFKIAKTKEEQDFYMALANLKLQKEQKKGTLMVYLKVAYQLLHIGATFLFYLDEFLNKIICKNSVVKNMYNKFIIHWYIFLFLYNIIIRTKHILKLVVNVYVWRKLWVN